MAMPPPNVTGVLHMGHAMFVTLEDVMARRARMQGKDVLWLPGTDHAGIATQMVVERALGEQDPPVSRKQLGREGKMAFTMASSIAKLANERVKTNQVSFRRFGIGKKRTATASRSSFGSSAPRATGPASGSPSTRPSRAP